MAETGDLGSRTARNRAKSYIDNPEKLKTLLGKADRKADRKKGPLSGVWEDLQTLFRMVTAYVTGKYRKIPWQSLLLAVAAIVYFVSPIDLIPDFILGLGLIDDASVIAWTINAIRETISHFRKWEQKQNSD